MNKIAKSISRPAVLRRLRKGNKSSWPRRSAVSRKCAHALLCIDRTRQTAVHGIQCTGANAAACFGMKTPGVRADRTAGRSAARQRTAAVARPQSGVDATGLLIFDGEPEPGALSGLSDDFRHQHLPELEPMRPAAGSPRGGLMAPAWQHRVAVRSTAIKIDPMRVSTAAVVAVGRIGASIVLTPEGAYGRLVFGWPVVRTAGPRNAELVRRARAACIEQYSATAVRLFNGMRAVERAATPLFAFGSAWPDSASSWRVRLVQDILTGIFVPPTGRLPVSRRSCGVASGAAWPSRNESRAVVSGATNRPLRSLLS
jgi:hypothetical protein